MRSLTKRQKQILSYLEEWIEQKGYAPTYREVMHHFGFQSVGSVLNHIKSLKAKGYLNGDSTKRRSLELSYAIPSKTPMGEVELPFVGMVEPPYPIEMYSSTKTMKISSSFIRFPDITYILQVQGNSLRKEHMLDGDLLLVEARQEAEPGEWVIANHGRNHTLIKRYFPEGEFIRLEGLDTMEPPELLRFEDLTIQGVVISLSRLYH